MTGRLLGGTTRRGLVALVLATAACTTAGGTGGGGGTAGGSATPSSCHSNPQWAVGDSLTAGVYGVAGWPNQAPAYGHFASLGFVGYTAEVLEGWTKDQVAACMLDRRPTEIVLAAGINDLARASHSTR